MSPPPILTIGHSTRPIDEFIALLRAHGVQHVLDVRTVPKSRRNPQFARDALAGSLSAAPDRGSYPATPFGCTIVFWTNT